MKYWRIWWTLKFLGMVIEDALRKWWEEMWRVLGKNYPTGYMVAV